MRARGRAVAGLRHGGVRRCARAPGNRGAASEVKVEEAAPAG